MSEYLNQRLSERVSFENFWINVTEENFQSPKLNYRKKWLHNTKFVKLSAMFFSINFLNMSINWQISGVFWRNFQDGEFFINNYRLKVINHCCKTLRLRCLWVFRLHVWVTFVETIWFHRFMDKCCQTSTAQKMKLSIKVFYSKCETSFFVQWM